MTENKRFTQKDEDDWEILARNKHFAYAHSGYQAKKIISELNELVETNRELYKENKQLKSDNKELQMRYDAQRELYCQLDCVKNNLYQDNVELKSQLDFLKDENKHMKSVLEENKQLKKTNQELYDELQTTIGYKSLKMGLNAILKKENEELKKQIADDFNQSNCITVQKSKIKELEEEKDYLKETMKEVAELLSEEVDLFSDKATEHDICAYVELKELDNKDAYYMAISTKKAIKMLKGDVE